jgi:predicted nucleic acid-binding Zn ribbon protein
VVQEQIKLACEGKEAELKKSYTSTGVKYKYPEYWINDLLSQFKKAVESGKSKAQTTEELKQWVKDHADDIYSAFLTTDGACSLSLQYSNH